MILEDDVFLMARKNFNRFCFLNQGAFILRSYGCRKEKTMLKQMRSLLLIVLLLCASSIRMPEAKAAGSVPLSVAVNGSLVVSDSDNDTAAGKDPTKNVNLTVTPDLGHTLQSGSANFRLRSNRAAWRLTAQRTASNAGGTSIADTDILVDIAKSTGTSANANAGALVAPFTAQTNLSSIDTAASVDIVNGTAKTSSARDGNNANNWFQVSTTYSIQPDFFYTPGTFSSTITYSLVSP